MMFSYLLLLLLVAPLLVSGAIAYLYSQSLFSLVGVVLGAAFGAIFILISGVSWLYTLQREWMESQAVGFVFLPVILPFYAYTGAIAGASLMAILSCYGHRIPFLFQMVAMGVTIGLSGLIPATMTTWPNSTTTHPEPRYNNNLVIIPMLAIGVGVASAGVASTLAYTLAYFLVAPGDRII
ncbi:hypothetical protein PN462_22690 [Spirulina sp. CS-785/01]|uniref:hypothetical protein n=1 Tax=Spirulina sp. CS-785/01 TaxID=3021716 RepID=UPI00232C90D4|nr:hypothetical protein [Spirulina sp. CS-785/01]MDB9315938.1 hypothetical protein [Spirulina sp. CS-785/01]